MKKIRQWLSDRRDRKLREKLLVAYKNPRDAAAVFDYIRTGKCVEWELYDAVLRLKVIDPEAFDKVYEEILGAQMGRCS